MNFQLTKEFIEKLELLIQNNDLKSIEQVLEKLLPPDIAEIFTSIDFYKAKYFTLKIKFLFSMLQKSIKNIQYYYKHDG